MSRIRRHNETITTDLLSLVFVFVSAESKHKFYSPGRCMVEDGMMLFDRIQTLVFVFVTLLTVSPCYCNGLREELESVVETERQYEDMMDYEGNNLRTGKTYLPVLMMHGIESNPKALNNLERVIREAHPGTKTIKLATPFDGVPGSWVTLNLQVKMIADAIRNYTRQDPKAFENGYHLVCHSQGALTCRAICELMDDHNVHTLVSLAGPQMGVYGAGWIQRSPLWYQYLSIEDGYLLAYMGWAQATLSIANMWNDPYHQKAFMERNTFLPRVNGYTNEKERLRMKSNFLRLKHAAFFVGNDTDKEKQPYDGGIEPWESGAWQFYTPTDPDSSEQGVKPPRFPKIQPMKDLDLYKRDLFGLRTLDESGRLSIATPYNCSHDAWIDDPSIIRKYIIPLLI